MTERLQPIKEWAANKLARITLAVALLGTPLIASSNSARGQEPFGTQPYVDILLDSETEVAAAAQVIAQLEGTDRNTDGLPDVLYPEDVNRQLEKIGFQVLNVQRDLAGAVAAQIPGAVVEYAVVTGQALTTQPSDPDIGVQTNLARSGNLDVILNTVNGVYYPANGDMQTVQVGIIDSPRNQHIDLPTPSRAVGPNDGTHSHSLMMASIINMYTGNGQFGASVGGGEFAEILYHGLGAQNYGTVSGVVAYIIQAAEEGVDVLNMSLGVKTFASSPYWELVQRGYAEAHRINPDMIVVVASGNDGDDTKCLSLFACADIPFGVIVGFTTITGKPHHASSTLPGKESQLVVTDGQSVYVLTNNDDGLDSYTERSGSSAATASVSALIGRALMYGADPHAVVEALLNTTTDMGDAGPDSKTGRGKVNPVLMFAQLVESGEMGSISHTYFPQISSTEEQVE